MLRRQLNFSSTASLVARCATSPRMAAAHSGPNVPPHFSLSLPISEFVDISASWACAPSVFHPTNTLFHRASSQFHPSLSYPADALAAAKADALEAEVSILELKFTIRCLQDSMLKNRNLTNKEYKALVKAADARINFDLVRLATSLKPFTYKKAEAKIEKAEAKIEKAEAKIEKAEAKIEKARLEAEIYYTPHSLVLDAENTAHTKSFSIQGTALGGRTKLLKMLYGMVAKRKLPSCAQESFTYTLAGTNGVGKTHCSFLIGSGELKRKQVLMLSAYCGINNEWSLSSQEVRYVKDELTLRDVMVTRVALALHHRANNLDSPWDSLKIPNTKILPYDPALKIVVAAIIKIKQSKRASKYVVFGVFDEIQLLEGQLKTTFKKPSRVVFRILRQLQLTLAHTGVLFVGFGTGTLFRSEESDATVGKNMVIYEPFCDRDAFTSLVPADTAAQQKILTRMIYPRARLIGKDPDTWLDYIGDINTKDAQRLLPHALEKSSLPIQQFGECVPFLGAHAPGADKFMVLDDYILMVACIRSLTCFQLSPNRFVNSCSAFESWVGDALCAVLAFATSFDAGLKVRKAIVKKNPWVSTVFGTSTPFNIPLKNVRIVIPDNSKSNILPFDGAGSLGNALKRNTMPVGQCLQDASGSFFENFCNKDSAAQPVKRD